MTATTRIGRPPSCVCGACPKCKRAAYMREWYRSKTPEQRRAMRATRDPDRVREGDRRKQQRRRTQGTTEQRAKIRARDEVRKARLRGDLIPEPCEVCGDTKTHAHHDDYSKPLDVRWLCRTHHEEHHAQAPR